jgi:hypothetical protein
MKKGEYRHAFLKGPVPSLIPAFNLLYLPFLAKNEILAPQYSNVLQESISTFLCTVTIAFIYGTHILLVDVSV